MSTAESPLTGKAVWFHGTGRRKESVARVFLRAGSGKFTVNRRTVDSYFPNHAWKHDAIEPLKFTNLDKLYFLSGGIEPGDEQELAAFQKEEAARKLFAIDINSRFEITAGVKDMTKVEAFVKNLRAQ